MPVEEARRRRLALAVAEQWGEEVADTLMGLVAPQGHEIATRADIESLLRVIEAMDERWEARFEALSAQIAAQDAKWATWTAAQDARWATWTAAQDARWAAWTAAQDARWATWTAAQDARWATWTAAQDARWDERMAVLDEKLASMEHRLRASFEESLRDAVTSQTRMVMVSLMVLVVAIAGLAFGLGG